MRVMVVGVHTGCQIRSHSQPSKSSKEVQTSHPAQSFKGPLYQGRTLGGGCPSRHFYTLLEGLFQLHPHWDSQTASRAVRPPNLRTVHPHNKPPLRDLQGPSWLGANLFSSSTLNLCYFLPQTLTSNRAETLIFPRTHWQPFMHLFCLCLEWPSSYHSPTHSVLPSTTTLLNATSSRKPFSEPPTQLHCLAWIPTSVSCGLLSCEKVLLLSDHELTMGTGQSHSYWFLSWGPTHVIRVQSFLSQWTDMTIIYVSQIYS